MMNRSIPSFALCALIGYCLGCSNMAFFLSRLKGTDLRKTGSKNLGTGNTYLTFGLGWSCLVFVHDAGKGALAVYLCRRLFPELPTAPFVAGSAAVLGHIFPFYLGFRGGKGFAAYLGMILMFNWRVGVVAILGVAAIALVSNYYVIASTVTLIAYPIYTAFVTHNIGAVAAVSVSSVVIISLHRQNFVRLCRGTEPKILEKRG